MGILPVLEQLQDILNTAQCEYEIIVVNDGSTNRAIVDFADCLNQIAMFALLADMIDKRTGRL